MGDPVFKVLYTLYRYQNRGPSSFFMDRRNNLPRGESAISRKLQDANRCGKSFDKRRASGMDRIKVRPGHEWKRCKAAPIGSRIMGILTSAGGHLSLPTDRPCTRSWRGCTEMSSYSSGIIRAPKSSQASSGRCLSLQD